MLFCSYVQPNNNQKGKTPDFQNVPVKKARRRAVFSDIAARKRHGNHWFDALMWHFLQRGSVSVVFDPNQTPRRIFH